VCYNSLSEHLSLNEERRHLFTKKGRDIQSIPPTHAPLIQHPGELYIKEGTVGLEHFFQIELYLALQIGDGSAWTHAWSTIEEDSKALSQLVKCCCEQSCAGRCKCKKVGLWCTALCACEDTCGQED
jgi:hypothetical protein